MDVSDFVLVEEICEDGKSGTNATSARTNVGKTTTRVLGANENVWQAQSKWRNTGRFVLENRKETVRSTLEKVRAFISQLEEAKQNITSQSTS
ncbi:hypothetical protein Y032_0076g1053 [Ancylostoma ceylanicum]|nr:hypothetical protein Y032_0076g1053 [Ancylostoma ceylanicum]